MEITRDQFEVVSRMAARMGGRFVLHEGTTIAPPKPPEAMVRLARKVAASYVVVDGEHSDTWVALAALQHAEKVVREVMGDGPLRRVILTELGADV